MSDSGPSFIFADSEDKRTIIQWQHDRFHKIQTLSQGIFGASLTVLAVFFAASEVLGIGPARFLQPIEPDVPQYISAEAAESILGLGVLHSIVILVLSASFYSLSLWYGVETLLRRPLPSQHFLSDNTVLSDSVEELSIVEGSNLDSVYTRLISENTRVLNKIEDRYYSVGFRFIGSLILLLLAFNVHEAAVDSKYLEIMAYSALPFLPIAEYARKYIPSGDSLEAESNVDEHEIGLLTEVVLDEEHQSNRLSDVNLWTIENLLIGLWGIICFVTWVVGIISYFA